MLMDKAKTVRSVQMDLFLPRPNLPQWAQLPRDVQKAARELLVQILREHWAEQLSVFSEKEVGHE
jgi:hypothetical protein